MAMADLAAARDLSVDVARLALARRSDLSIKAGREGGPVFAPLKPSKGVQEQ
jgi:hypothetical protein